MTENHTVVNSKNILILKFYANIVGMIYALINIIL
ncbi:MAG: hypothetical protein K0R07_540 [Sedimentibacter sp.]|nr:hypothetical protein [Sedimentibacter sp.]